jgi:mRNA-degrading endonuclease RelE of RelBE toxin-antitoxin system
MWRVRATSQFKNDIRKVPSKVIAKADRLLVKLKRNPTSSEVNARKLAKVKEKV